MGEAAVGDHFAAVSTRLDKVAEFGIRPDRVFGFWDWVGGRYSLWSAIGLSLAILIGPENFEDFLRGGHDVDEHFRSAPLSHNIPVLMGLIGIWHRNIWGFAAQAVIPYDQRLARFPAYLQQLDMESNGKSVLRDGAPSPRATGPIVFGEPGTNSQHAFFQLLHQGTEMAPVDFLVAAEPIHADETHHALLFANCLAQSEAFLRGRSEKEVRDILRAQGLSAARIDELAPHKVFSGDRPSSTLLYRQLNPRTLGRIVALYEHKVFVQSVIWDINPFDQWGVELGKELCGRLAPLVSDASADLSGLDGSTAGLISTRRALQGSRSFVLAEAIGDEGGDGVHRFLRLRAGGRDRDRAADAGAERQDAHDRLAADGFAATRHSDLGVELFGAVNEFRRRACVQALAIDDRQFARDRALGRRRIGWAIAGGPASSKSFIFHTKSRWRHRCIYARPRRPGSPPAPAGPRRAPRRV